MYHDQRSRPGMMAILRAHQADLDAGSDTPQRPPRRRPREASLDKKRARDRRAQQALRDRTRSTIHNLTEQVTTLTRIVEHQSHELAQLRLKLDAASRGAGVGTDTGTGAGCIKDIQGRDPSPVFKKIFTPQPDRLWEIPPLNSVPTNVADQLFQGFVNRQREKTFVAAASPRILPAPPSRGPQPRPGPLPPPDITSLISPQRCGSDEVSKVASDVVRAYAELDTLPKQIAIHYVMTHLLKWLVLLDEPSWNMVPVWLRPTVAQRTVEHDAWIDRIPWPSARDYLVAHPEITLDRFAARYGTALSIRWPYDESLIVLATATVDESAPDYRVNPIFEQHVASLANWAVGDAFRQAFPELARLIEEGK